MRRIVFASFCLVALALVLASCGTPQSRVDTTPAPSPVVRFLGPEVAPEKAKRLNEWPEAIVGFSEAEAAASFLRMVREADFSKYPRHSGRQATGMLYEATDVGGRQIEYFGSAKALRAAVDAANTMDDDPREYQFNRPVSEWREKIRIETSLNVVDSAKMRQSHLLDGEVAFIAEVNLAGEETFYYSLLHLDGDAAWHFNLSQWRGFTLWIGSNQTWDLLKSLKPKNERERLALAYFSLKIFNNVVLKWWELDCGWRAEDMLSHWRGAWAFSHFANNPETDQTKAYALACYHFEWPYLASEAAAHQKIIVPRAIADHRKTNDGPWNFPNEEQAGWTWKTMELIYGLAVATELVKKRSGEDD